MGAARARRSIGACDGAREDGGLRRASAAAVRAERDRTGPRRVAYVGSARRVDARQRRRASRMDLRSARRPSAGSRRDDDQRVIQTPRLDLVVARERQLRAELESAAALAAALGCVVPSSWPPEFYDADAVRYSLNWL